ncbi:hypothetical protein LXA43DRAFT_593111 [Ganoderma leucocontextum]|nr:hypothetical protein LXA43DRAFT_593111 [Ganoderma leucocontextum]
MLQTVGVVQSTTHDAGQADSREFQVEVRPWVRDDNWPCTVTCVMPGNAARWRKVRLPVHVLRGMRGVSSESENILIPRTSPRISFSSTLTTSGHTTVLTLLCLQFSLAAAYATTFNSCQELTLDNIS